MRISDWSSDVCSSDLQLAPVTIIAHSFGANLALRYAGIYPENVARLVAIEGLGLPPQFEAKLEEMGIDGRMRRWIDQQRQLAGRQPRRYATIDEDLARVREENRENGRAACGEREGRRGRTRGS